jgi:hypothetical protein
MADTKTASSLLIIWLLAGLIYAKTSSEVQNSWEEDFHRLQQQIEDRGFLEKAMAGSGSLAPQILDRHALIWDEDRTPLDVQLRRTRALIQHLKTLPGIANLSNFEKQFHKIIMKQRETMIRSTPQMDMDWDTYMTLRKITRHAALTNPLLDFDTLLFVARGGGIGHCVGQYFGYTAEAGGSIYMAVNFKDSLQIIDIVANSTVQNGRLQGQTLAGGAFLSPDLSFDGKTILFAWRDPGPTQPYDMDDPRCFNRELSWHLFKVNVDGSNLVQLTDGPRRVWPVSSRMAGANLHTIFHEGRRQRRDLSQLS